jgi:transposase-like protein
MGSKPRRVIGFARRSAGLVVAVGFLLMSDQNTTCSFCKLAHIWMWNIGEFDKPKWICHGCCKRLAVRADAQAAALRQVYEISKGPASNRRLMQVAGPHRQIINIIKPFIQ